MTTRHDGVQSASQHATVDSWLDLAWSRQHGVAAKNRATNKKAKCLLNAHGNDI